MSSAPDRGNGQRVPNGVATHDDAVLLLRAVRDATGQPVDAVIETVNESWRRQVAPQLSSLAGLSFRNDFPRLAGDRWPHVAACLETGEQRSLVYPNYGDPSRWGEVHLTPLGDDRLLIVVREVTGSEEQREALRRSDARFRDALDRSPDTIALFRPILGDEGRLEDIEALFVNRPALDRWYGGVDLRDLAGKRLFEVQPAGRRYLQDIYRHVLETGEPYEATRPFESPTGLFWAQVRVARTAEGIVHTSKDVTAAVLAEEALTRSLYDLQEAQRVGRVGSFEWDARSDTFACSPEYARLLGFDPGAGTPSREDRMGRSDPAERASVLREIQGLIQAGGGSWEREMWATLPGGGRRCLLFRGRVTVTAEGMAHVAGTATDITDLRTAQDQATAAKEQLASVAEAVEEALALARPVRDDAGVLVDLAVEWANPAWMRREGLEGSSPAGLRGFELHPEFRRLVPAIEEVLASGVPRTTEVGIENGRWLAVSLSALHGSLLVASLDVTDRRAAQELAGDRLRAALERTADAISITDADGRLVYVNRAFEAMSGVSRIDALGRVPDILRLDGDESAASDVDAQLHAGEPFHGTVERTRADGTHLVAETSINPIADAAGGLAGFVAITRDVTEARAEAARRAQTDRMETIGQLAGGVAHDFNNILVAISGYAAFVLDHQVPGTADHDDLLQVLGATDRAAALTKRLLAFSRRQVIEPRAIDVVATVDAVLPMIRRLIGEHIVVEATVTPGIPRVFMDPGQLDQMLINLAVNARDAMPSGGRISVGLAPAKDEGGRRLARITVSDTGTGMHEDVLAHIFEPFFTTKEVGRGTGLGLATVYGIVADCDGHVEVASTVGVGTTFTIDVPGIVAASEKPADAPTETAGGQERILVVEDDPQVRGVAVRLLRSLGYRVAEAGSAEQAVEALGRGDSLDLVITDVRMPVIQGPDLVRALRARHPGLRVLFMTGLIDELPQADRADVEVLLKPFDRDSLGSAVRRALA